VAMHAALVAAVTEIQLQGGETATAHRREIGLGKEGDDIVHCDGFGADEAANLHETAD